MWQVYLVTCEMKKSLGKIPSTAFFFKTAVTAFFKMQIDVTAVFKNAVCIFGKCSSFKSAVCSFKNAVQFWKMQCMQSYFIKFGVRTWLQKFSSATLSVGLLVIQFQFNWWFNLSRCSQLLASLNHNQFDVKKTTSSHSPPSPDIQYYLA